MDVTKDEKSNFEQAYERVEAAYLKCKTRTERKRMGYCCYPEYNIGAWFDSRNPLWAQPNHPIWQGNDQWGFRAPVLEAYMRKLNMIPD